LKFDVYNSDVAYWIEHAVPWGDPVYPEDTDEDSPSPGDTEESGSEFVPSGSISE
jgi:hypothetical protein